MSLSILIPTLPQRKVILGDLLNEINEQRNCYDVEVLTDSRDETVTTGVKRNSLLERATKKYVWFVDDDDMIMPGAIAAIFKAMESNPDCMAIDGIMTTDGGEPERFRIFKGCDDYIKMEGVYYRFTNHITPIRASIAKQIKFENLTYHDDYKWAVALKESGLLKTEAVVETPVYHYIVTTNKGNVKDFDKQYFQEVWGEEGYYENFSYGVGIDAVCERCLYPFVKWNTGVLEIGIGGGVFAERLILKSWRYTAIDVIKMPVKFESLQRDTFTYIELPDKNYDCYNVPDNSIDFAFCYNVFCHLSNEALTRYIQSVNRVLKKGSYFVFMLSNIDAVDVHKSRYKLGDLLPMGHFYQDSRTVHIVTDWTKWKLVNPNMIPEHRDIIVQLQKI